MKTSYSQGHTGRGFISGVVALSLLGGCAKVQNDYVARPLDPTTGRWAEEGGPTRSGLVITGEESEQLSSEHFGVVDVTFENKTRRWIRVQAIRLRFESPEHDRGVSVPDGEELRAWARATHQRLYIQRHNRETGLALVALAGMTTAAVSNNREVAAVGGLAAAGSLAALGADEANQAVERAEQPAVPLTPAYYESHLMNAPFSVPPGLFSKRWVTLSTAGDGAPCVRSLIIDYELEGGQQERVHLTFRDHRHRSEWQERECFRGTGRRRYSNGSYAND